MLDNLCESLIKFADSTTRTGNCEECPKIKCTEFCRLQKFLFEQKNLVKLVHM